MSLVRTALRVLFYALLAAALAIALFPELSLGVVAAAVLCGTALASLLASAALAPDAVAHAKAYDDAVGLADRLSSVLELESARGPMVEALRAEAVAAANATPPSRVYPHQLPREGRWLPMPGLALALAIFLPTLFAPDATADEAFVTSLEERVDQLEDLLSQERNKELSERNKELLEELQKLKAQLDEENVDKKDTQAEVARLLEQMRKEADQQKEKEAELKKLLKSLQENTQRKDLDPHIQQGDYQQALNKLREELEELRKKLADKKKEGASKEELEELEEMIEKLRELETKLMQLLQLNLDLAFLGKTIDFLHEFDGELGDLAEFDPAAIEPGEP